MLAGLIYCNAARLLAAWSAASGRPLAWLSLDDDNDPVRFWRYLIPALGAASRNRACARERGLPDEGAYPPSR